MATMGKKYGGKQSSFALNLSGFAMDQVRGTLNNFSELLIKATPVDTGRLRGNWQSTIGTPASGTLEVLDKSGEDAIKRAQETITKMKAGDVFYLTNNLPYAIPIEYGHSQAQAPNGMLRTTLAMASAEVDKARAGK